MPSKNVNVGEYLTLKSKERILFNGLQQCISPNGCHPKEIKAAAEDWKKLSRKIEVVESELREALQNKKTVYATA